MERLGVLISAGLTPYSAWRHLLARSEPLLSPKNERQLLDDLGEGLPPTAALLAEAGRHPAGLAEGWRRLAAAWALAGESGAALSPSLHALAEALRSRAEIHHDLDVASAGPRSTLRLIAALPLLGVACGEALGFPVAATLVGTTPGRVLLAVGVALLLIAVFWARRILRAASRYAAPEDVLLDLTAIGLAGGGPPGGAREQAESWAEQCGLSLPLGGRRRLTEILELSEGAGVPAGLLLGSESIVARRLERTDLRRRAERAGVRLMLPLGLAALPSYICLGVFPLVLSLLNSTGLIGPAP
ncbi:type II secretion system F family protein [Mycetocola spongiae]|uniref:type II secretion system F family protein n=1 Tax=Mycetocola spongiae TaxID=2859226 RepID=UPI001CF22E22|nr:type II secretion system F family protein [Mycetocola spongiae]UCR87855.1 type II secretion system F family protein [Mycetocola spongiae]